jgi:hypothetical protein
MLSEILERRIRRQIGSLVGGLSSMHLCYSPRQETSRQLAEAKDDDDEEEEEEKVKGDHEVDEAKNEGSEISRIPRGVDLELSFTEMGR